MALKIQFVHDGKTTEYILSQDATLQINAPAPSSPSPQIQVINAVLAVTGAVPWGGAVGVDMVVNTPQLKVRNDKTTAGEPVAILLLGEKLTVSKTSEKIGKITWRQIIKPDKFVGKWVAESFEGDTNAYLILGSTPTYVPPATGAASSVATASAQAAPSSGAAMASPQAAPTSAGITTSPSGEGIAPLTGRFTLVKRKGPHSTYSALAIDGDSSRKLGVNIRELAYFGTPQWQWTREQWLPAYASNTKALGMKWVRFFAAHVAYSNDQIVARMKKVLDALAQEGLLAVVCLADSLSEKGMFPRGDEQWHSGSRGHLVKDYFNTGAYRANYMPFLQRIVTEFRNHPGVGMWQLMNELAIYNPPANDNDVKGFTTFVDEASEAIYRLDSVHPISVGIINTAHIMPPGKDIRQFAREFYSKRKFIHIVSGHCYQYDHDTNPGSLWEHEENCAIDAEIANETGRAMFWTEFGAMNGGDRRASSERFLNSHFIKGPASGALQWGFMLELDAIPDSGIGDSRYGFSKTLNTGYEQLSDLFKNLPSKS
jgi:hypothetical protein